MEKRKKISIILPVYFNEMNIEDTVNHLMLLPPQREDLDFEFVFVDDGSGDASYQLLQSFQDKHPDRIRLLKLTRNFGSMAAIQAGFSRCTGDYAGFIAADLQDPPELFLEMLKILEAGKKVCLAIRSDRKDPFLQKSFAKAFYFLLRKFALKGYPPGGFDFLLVKREVVDCINQVNEKNANVMNLIFWMGYPYATIPYVRRAREKGTSKWTFGKRFKLFIDSFVGYSYFPVRFISISGILFALSSFAYLTFIFINWLNGNIPVQGWTAMMMFIAFVSGTQMLMLGILGEYLWRSLDESRKRPSFIIDEIS